MKIDYLLGRKYLTTYSSAGKKIHSFSIPAVEEEIDRRKEYCFVENYGMTDVYIFFLQLKKQLYMPKDT